MIKRRYMIFCNTDNAYMESIQLDGNPPTQCPINPTHSVNTNLIIAGSLYQDSAFAVTEQLSIPVGGSYRAEQIKLDIPPLSTYTKIIKWPVNVVILNFQITSDDSNMGDTIEAVVAPNANIGAITNNLVIGATTIYVQASVISNLYLGYFVKVTDGVNTDDLGQVTYIDNVNNYIIVEKPTTHNFSAASPSYIQMSIKTLTNYELGPKGSYNLGSKKLGGKGIPANVPTVITYNNLTNVSKKLWIIVEYLY